MDVRKILATMSVSRGIVDMKLFRRKAFFIKSFLLHLFLSIVVIGLSWSLIEPNAYNFMVKSFVATKPGDSSIALIVIDDKSIEYHRWPWPREYYAQMMDFLNEYSRTKLIGYDAILTTLDKDNPESDEYFFETIKKIPNLVVGFSPHSSLMNQKPMLNMIIYSNKSLRLI